MGSVLEFFQILNPTNTHLRQSFCKASRHKKIWPHNYSAWLTGENNSKAYTPLIMFPGLLWALQAVRKWDRVVWEDGTVRHLPPISLSVDFCTQGFTLYVPFFSNCCIGVFSFSCATLHPWPSFGDPFFGSFFLLKIGRGSWRVEFTPFANLPPWSRAKKSQQVSHKVSRVFYIVGKQHLPWARRFWCKSGAIFLWCCGHPQNGAALLSKNMRKKKRAQSFQNSYFLQEALQKLQEKPKKNWNNNTKKNSKNYTVCIFPLGKAKDD